MLGSISDFSLSPSPSSPDWFDKEFLDPEEELETETLTELLSQEFDSEDSASPDSPEDDPEDPDEEDPDPELEDALDSFLTYLEDFCTPSSASWHSEELDLWFCLNLEDLSSSICFKSSTLQ